MLKSITIIIFFNYSQYIIELDFRSLLFSQHSVVCTDFKD